MGLSVILDCLFLRDGNLGEEQSSPKVWFFDIKQKEDKKYSIVPFAAPGWFRPFPWLITPGYLVSVSPARALYWFHWLMYVGRPFSRGKWFSVARGSELGRCLTGLADRATCCCCCCSCWLFSTATSPGVVTAVPGSSTTWMPRPSISNVLGSGGGDVVVRAG